MECIVVAYDIASNDRRQLVSDTLGAVGSRVQLSVFECRFDDGGAVDAMVRALMAMIDPVEDQIRVYSVSPLSADAMGRVLGDRIIEEHRGFWLL